MAFRENFTRWGNRFAGLLTFWSILPPRVVAVLTGIFATSVSWISELVGAEAFGGIARAYRFMRSMTSCTRAPMSADACAASNIASTSCRSAIIRSESSFSGSSTLRALAFDAIAIPRTPEQSHDLIL
jgi:hypothetical protein